MPPRKNSRQQPAEDDVRVGDRQPFAFAIADRTGIGAGAFRTHFQRASGIEFRDRAAAGADGVDVHHRNADRHAVDLAFVRHLDFVFAQRNVGRRATHVERDDVGVAADLRNMKRADDTAGRARTESFGRARPRQSAIAPRRRSTASHAKRRTSSTHFLQTRSR